MVKFSEEPFNVVDAGIDRTLGGGTWVPAQRTVFHTSTRGRSAGRLFQWTDIVGWPPPPSNSAAP